MKKSNITYNYPINLIQDDNKLRIHLYTVHLSGAKKMELHFGDIRLPAGSYVELADNARKYVYTHTFAELTEYHLAMFSDTVSIKVVLPKSFNDDEKPSFKLISVEDISPTDKDDTQVIKDPQWEAYKCYEGTDIGVHALSSAAFGFKPREYKKFSSCELIGSDNLVLTNAHVVRKKPFISSLEVWLNYFNESCDLNSIPVEPVRIQCGELLKVGDYKYGDTDYALFSLNDFDYRNAHVKKLFGGLKIRQSDYVLGELVYHPHYADCHPMLISAVQDGKPCSVVGGVDGGGATLRTNTQMVAGGSGSSILSRETHEIVALAFASNEEGITWGYNQ